MNVAGRFVHVPSAHVVGLPLPNNDIFNVLMADLDMRRECLADHYKRTLVTQLKADYFDNVFVPSFRASAPFVQLVSGGPYAAGEDVRGALAHLNYFAEFVTATMSHAESITGALIISATRAAYKSFFSKNKFSKGFNDVKPHEVFLRFIKFHTVEGITTLENFAPDTLFTAARVFFTEMPCTFFARVAYDDPNVTTGIVSCIDAAAAHCEYRRRLMNGEPVDDPKPSRKRAPAKPKVAKKRQAPVIIFDDDDTTDTDTEEQSASSSVYSAIVLHDEIADFKPVAENDVDVVFFDDVIIADDADAPELDTHFAQLNAVNEG